MKTLFAILLLSILPLTAHSATTLAPGTYTVAACPVPDNGMFVGDPTALLAMLTLAPVTAPTVVGANVTVIVTD